MTLELGHVDRAAHLDTPAEFRYLMAYTLRALSREEAIAAAIKGMDPRLHYIGVSSAEESRPGVWRVVLAVWEEA